MTPSYSFSLNLIIHQLALAIMILFPTIITAQSDTLDLGNYQLSSMRDLTYEYEVKYADLEEGLQIAYVDEGHGHTAILMIHGLGSYIPAWRHNLRELSQHHRCIALDLPGYGKSSKEPHSGLMSYYANVILQLMDHLNLKTAYLAGHSMGAQIAVTAAHRHPSRISGLILAAPAGFEKFTTDQKQWFKTVMSSENVKNTPIPMIRKNTANNFYRMPGDAQFMISDRIAIRSADDFDSYCMAIVKSVHGMLAEPIFEILPEITQPTLVLYGEEDQLIPNPYLNPGPTKEIAESGTAQLKRAQLIMLPETGHFLPYERADKFNQEVLKFINELK